MAQETTPRTFPGSLYFVYNGCTVAVIAVVTFIAGWRKHTWDEDLTRSMILLLVMTVTYGCIAFAPKLPWLTWLRLALNPEAVEDKRSNDLAVRKIGTTRLHEGFVWTMSGIFAVSAIVLLSGEHRRFVVVVGLLQASAIFALRGPMVPRAMLSIAVLSVSTWGLAAGLSYTNFGDLILNSNASSLAVLAFVGSFGLVLIELCDDGSELKSGVGSRRAMWVALLVFLAFSLRSDNLLDSWIPYHRSFIVDTAQSVRDGHWLLWDVPSLYGFLSVAAVAAVPARNAWQGLFILTAAFLLIQSWIIFTLWRWGRSGWTNFAFALLVTLATFGDGISRYPWSGRLYSQGGLRFIWALALLWTVFLMYVWREDRRRVATLYWAGHGIWLISLLWSFETAVWGTVVWIPYLVLSEVTRGSGVGLATRLARRLWPIVLLPVAAACLIVLIYAYAVGGAPDWASYVEFTGLFVSGNIRSNFPINASGAGWCLVLSLGAVGSVGITAIRRRNWPAVQLLAATWLTVWATSTYFTVEPFDGHVALLLCVVLPAGAIVTFVSREALNGDRTALFARLSIAPIAILCIMLFLDDPVALARMKFPLQPGWTTDTLATLPPISGELSLLMKRAGIHPGDPVLIPHGPFWTEISQGMLFPVAYEPGVGNVEYRAWAPLSPLGMRDTIMGLGAARRAVITERFLERSGSAGWYVEYRGPASCELISPTLQTVKSLESPNYSVSLCAKR